MARPKGPHWISFDIWTCPRHIPMTKFPPSVKACWYCGAEQPPAAIAPPPPPREYGAPPGKIRAEVGTERCAWPGCPNMATTKSKYCSRNCSNKNARRRAAERKKTGEPLGQEEVAE